MRRFGLLFPLLLLVCIGCNGVTIGTPGTNGDSPCCPGVCPQETPAPENVEVLAFTAKWCDPCQRDKPKLADLRATGVKVTVIDIDKNPGLKRQYGVKSVPTYIVLEDGVEIERTESITLILSIIAAILQAVWPFVAPLLA